MRYSHVYVYAKIIIVWHNFAKLLYQQEGCIFYASKCSAKRRNLDVKTSSPDTQSLRVQMSECVNYSRK